MQATFSVAPAQVRTFSALHPEKLPVLDYFHYLLDTRFYKNGILLPYIDDITRIGTYAVDVNKTRDLAAANLTSVYLSIDPKMDFSADESLYQIALGLA